MMTWMQNSWMDNPTFLAEMAHFAWAYGVLLTAALFSVSRRHMACLFLAFTTFAVFKEFWYDLTYELPNDSLGGSALDFAVYCLGLVVALAVIWLQRHVARQRRLNAMVDYTRQMELTPTERLPRKAYSLSRSRLHIYDPHR